MLFGIGNATKIPDLRNRILVTLLLLFVYRLGVYVSTPGVNVEALRKMFGSSDGGIFGLMNMFSGGSLENFSIFTLGITPYISVSIILQLLTPVIPALDALKKEGAAGQRIITKYTRQGTVVLALVQSYLIATGLERSSGLVLAPGWEFRISTMLTLTAGTAFIMWLGEQITERGIGNGVSMIIVAGIVARMPRVLLETFALARTGEVSPLAIIGAIIFCLATIAGIIFIERSQRRVPVQYPRRMVGNMVAQTQTQYLPLKLNMAGVIPPIFAYAFFGLPATVAQFSSNEWLQAVMRYLSPGHPMYYVIFITLNDNLGNYISILLGKRRGEVA